MPALDRDHSLLLVVDFQQRLMPAIGDAAAIVENARRLCRVAAALDVPVLFTEENAAGLGPTIGELADHASDRTFHKMHFDACCEPGFVARIGDRSHIVVAGCEAHVCVLQTVLGLIGAGRQVHVVRDAVGSRRAESKEAAIARMATCSADIVTTEMVIFEWLKTAADPRFREVLALIK